MTRGLALLSYFVFLYLLGPIFVIVASAFGTTNYMAFPPQGFTLRWFQAALADSRYVDAFFTSFTVAVAATAVAVGIGLPAAYAIARFDFPGRRLIEAAILMPLVLPALVLSIALAILYSQIGFSAGSGRLILAHIVICTPYVIRVAIPIFQGSDPALEEASRNLGASPLVTFFLVTLPVTRPGIIAAATLAFIVSFDEIELAIFLASPRAPTLPVTIFSAIQFSIDPTVGAVSALLIIVAVTAMSAYQILLWRKDRM